MKRLLNLIEKNIIKGYDNVVYWKWKIDDLYIYKKIFNLDYDYRIVK